MTRRGSIPLLQADPGLGAGLDPKRFELARERIVTPVATVEQVAGSVRADPAPPPADTTLLILTGQLIRRLVVASSARSELLGRAEVVRPWDHKSIAAVPAASAIEWRVLEPARVAIIDEVFLAAVAPWPEVVGELIARSVRRSHWLAVSLALRSLPRVEDRLPALFWHLSARSGAPTPDGVRLKLELGEELISELIGDPLPDVRAALAELSRSGALRREPDGSWLLGALEDETAGLLHIPPFAR